MLLTILGVLALLAPLPFVLADTLWARPAIPVVPPRVDAFESVSGCTVIPGRTS